MSIKTELFGHSIELATDPEVFSPNAVDKGTTAMLGLVDFAKEKKVLDLGCGTGVVGVLAAKSLPTSAVFMVDVDPRAVAASKRSCELNGVAGIDVRQSDAFSNVTEREFSLILSNPPYHVDFAVPKRMIEGAFRYLEVGGRLMMVTKRLDWYKNKIQTVFGGVRVHEIDGYYVFVAEKRGERVKRVEQPKRTMSKKLERKMKRKK